MQIVLNKFNLVMSNLWKLIIIIILLLFLLCLFIIIFPSNYNYQPRHKHQYPLRRELIDPPIDQWPKFSYPLSK